MSENRRVHEDWSTAAFDLDAVAPGTGPFVRRDVLRSWFEHRGRGGDVLLVDVGSALLPLYADGTTLQFLGETDLTDYHSPLGHAHDVTALTAAYFAEVPPGTTITLDSLPLEAADPLEEGLERAGISVVREQHEVAAVLELPPSFDDWLGAIGKKERHEVRRKRRKFAAELGSPRLQRATGRKAVLRFAEMHRAAAGEKGSFMSANMVELFCDLHERAGAVVDMVTTPDGSAVAAAFGFQDDDAYYLYNSAYDPAVRRASPGVVLLAELVERSIQDGKQRLDFLKGDETYKFRHGAEPRPLFSLRGIVPG